MVLDRDMRADSPVRPWRHVVVGVLVVLGTVGIWVAAVDGQLAVLRVTAAVVGAGAAIGAVLLARRRRDLVGWFVLAAGVALFRVLTG
jgi:hypothetical protein